MEADRKSGFHLRKGVDMHRSVEHKKYRQKKKHKISTVTLGVKQVKVNTDVFFLTPGVTIHYDISLSNGTQKFTGEGSV